MEGVELLEQAAEKLVAFDPTGLSDEELREALVRWQRAEFRLVGAKSGLVRVLERRRAYRHDGSKSTAAWLARRTKMPLPQARAQTRLVRRLAVMPQTEAALAAGQIGQRHAEVLAALADSARQVVAGACGEAEDLLVGFAKDLCFEDFVSAVRQWEYLVDADGVEQRAGSDHESRHLHLSQTFRGNWRLDGQLDVIAGTEVAEALRRISEEMFRADWADAQAVHGDDTREEHLARTARQRRADALAEMARRSERCGGPSCYEIATADTPAVGYPPISARSITATPWPWGAAPIRTTAKPSAAPTTATRAPPAPTSTPATTLPPTPESPPVSPLLARPISPTGRRTAPTETRSNPAGWAFEERTAGKVTCLKPVYGCAVARGETWDPDQYHRFAAERRRPFDDLLGLMLPTPGGRVVDLGCGTGELTAELHRRLGASETVGIDSSAAMLARARSQAGAGLRFEHGDLTDWTPLEPVDVVFANASLQWAPDHPAVLASLVAGLAPSGQIAFQVPANHDHPAHSIAAELGAELGLPLVGPAASVLAPETYAMVLHDLGLGIQHVRLQVYGFELPSASDVVEWTKGTLLTGYRAQLDGDAYDRFEARYRQDLKDRLGNRRPYFYAFKRILAWARRGAPSSR